MVEDIAFKKSKSNFLAFSVDDIIVKDKLDFKKCMSTLRDTGAYGFFLRLGHNINYCYMANGPQKVKSTIKIKDNIHAWQFSMGEKDWAYPNNVDMTLYKKEDIKSDIESLEYDTPNFFEGRWDGLSKKNRVGLFFTNSAIVNIPANIVNEVFDNRNMSVYSTVELLDKFNNDEKIDIKPFYQVKNSSPHMESEFKFIKWDSDR